MNTANPQTPNLAWFYLWLHEQAEELRTKKKIAATDAKVGTPPIAANSSVAHQHYKPKLRKTKRPIKVIG